VYAVSNELISTYSTNAFPNSIVYLVCCHGLQYPSQMGQAFIDKGAKVVVGWNESNCFADYSGYKLFDYMLSNQNTLNSGVNYLKTLTRKLADGSAYTNYTYDNHNGASHPPTNMVIYPATAGDYKLPTESNVPDGPVELQKGLVAYYPFDGDAKDKSGLANHGVNYGATYTAGRKGQAANFDGASYIEILNSASLDFSTDSVFSISLWSKVEDLSKRRYILTRGDGFNLQIDENFYRLYLGNYNNIDTKQKPILNKWEFVTLVVSFPERKIEIYLNGILVVSKTLSYSSFNYYSNYLFSIGGDDRGGAKFKGNIDDIRIYNRALTASEVEALYNE
jgi:hypothetical protein